MSRPPRDAQETRGLAATPLLCQVAESQRTVVVVPLTDHGIEQILTEGAAPLQAEARRAAGLEPGAGPEPVWRYTTMAVANLPATIPDMATLDRLLGRRNTHEPVTIRVRQNLDEASVVLHIPADMYWFQGHFPGLPVLPGVVQLKWAIERTGLVSSAGSGINAIHQLKFKSPLLPNSVVKLAIRREETDGTLVFSFRSADGEVSSGRLTYNAP